MVIDSLNGLYCKNIVDSFSPQMMKKSIEVLDTNSNGYHYDGTSYYKGESPILKKDQLHRRWVSLLLIQKVNV